MSGTIGWGSAGILSEIDRKMDDIVLSCSLIVLMSFALSATVRLLESWGGVAWCGGRTVSVSVSVSSGVALRVRAGVAARELARRLGGMINAVNVNKAVKQGRAEQ